MQAQIFSDPSAACRPKAPITGDLEVLLRRKRILRLLHLFVRLQKVRKHFQQKPLTLIYLAEFPL